MEGAGADANLGMLAEPSLVVRAECSWWQVRYGDGDPGSFGRVSNLGLSNGSGARSVPVSAISRSGLAPPSCVRPNRPATTSSAAASPTPTAVPAQEAPNSTPGTRSRCVGSRSLFRVCSGQAVDGPHPCTSPVYLTRVPHPCTSPVYLTRVLQRSTVGLGQCQLVAPSTAQ